MKVFGGKRGMEAEPVRFIDHLRSLWGISDGPREPDWVEPGAYSTDIYAKHDVSTQADESRRRTDWPY